MFPHSFCIGLLALSSAAMAQDLGLPFNGRWFVLQGGDTINVNHHMSSTAQRFGIDFAKTGGEGNRELARSSSPKTEDFYSWSEPVLSPADGETILVVNDLPDNPLGAKDSMRPAGNHIVIKTIRGQYIFLAHFKQGTIKFSPGDQVKQGQFLGRCGNSGNSDIPHIHIHIQDQAIFNTGLGQNPTFKGIDVELSGKIFQNVTWPLIRGLFVSPH